MTSPRASFPTLASIISLSLLSAACATDDTPGGGSDDSTQEALGCEESVTVLADLEALTPEGFIIADLVESRIGTHQAELVWVDPQDQPVQVDVQPAGESTPMVLALTYDDGELRYIDSVPAAGAGGDAETQELGAECIPRVEADVLLQIQTEDGALVEQLPVVLRAEIEPSGIGLGYVRHELDLDALAGSLTAASIEPADPSELGFNLWIDFPVDAEGNQLAPLGRLGGWAEYHHGEGSDATMSMSEFTIAVFGGWEG